jgi:hypothetical protein
MKNPVVDAIVAVQKRKLQAEMAKAAARIRAVEKQMHDAPFDYAELIGDWSEELRFIAQDLETAAQ